MRSTTLDQPKICSSLNTMSQRIIPQVTMDNVPISGLPELATHLQQLVDDPATPFNVKLLDDIELQLTEDNIPPLLPTLLPPLTTILKSTPQDPTPLLSLTIKLLSPLSLTRTLTIADPPSLLAALRSPLPGANLLALAILHKAAASPPDAAILAEQTEVVEELVKSWLLKDDTGVGEKAAKVLGDVLETDCDVLNNDADDDGPRTDGINGTHAGRPREPGEARLWRLLLLNRSVLSIIPSACSPDGERTERQVSVSQGRLLRLLTRLATLNIRAITRTPHGDIFPLPAGLASGAGQGLLQWAALGMVDRSDVLMHLNLIDFFETFVSVMRVSGRSEDSDEAVKRLVRTAVRNDQELGTALRSLPNRTIEEEAEPLRGYIRDVLG